MAKTVAVIVVTSPKMFSWLGHMPIMNWSLAELTEVRGIDRIVCAAAPAVADRARKLLGKDDIEVVDMPRDLADAKPAVLDKWLTAANGPAFDADTLVVTTASSPFLKAPRVEACVRAVNKGQCTHAQLAREVSLSGTTARRVKGAEVVESVRVFRVNVPAEQVAVRTVPVSMIESLDINQPDEFVLADALVAADKV